MFKPVLDNKALNLDNINYCLAYSDNFISLDDPSIDEAHIHDYFEIYLNISGDVSFLVKNHIYKMDFGDIIITRPNELHHCIYNKSCLHKHFCLWMKVENSVVTEFLNDIEFCYITLKNEQKDLIIKDFFDLSKSLENSNTFESTFLILKILSFLKNESHLKKVNQSENLPQELQKILDYINTNFAELSHINKLFDIFFISPSTLNRWFAKYLHISPKNYLDSVKLSKAKQLLDSGESVTNTATFSGYSDCSHFISIFKQKFGKTPLQYKNESK